MSVATKEVAHAGCACGVGERTGRARKAVQVDPAAKARNLVRLKRIEGQVRGVHKMIDEDRYCADVMTQIASVQEALRAVGRELMRNHLRHCATRAIREGGTEADAMYDAAVRIVADTRRCSTSWIQRKLGVGYNRAAKIVEAMEKRGLVGPANGAKDREVLIAPI